MLGIRVMMKKCRLLMPVNPPLLPPTNLEASRSPKPTQSDAGVVEQTDKAGKSSHKRKETDSQSTSSKKRMCRIKLKKAPRLIL
ncbi:hypothetical protein PR202_gb00218 [Eleusine coracana subsp. coracana]|uniref:Uncharacterized protein n=1 Tax=Eleusine coracana subsp. coracana TaxID=191504 RepID=A0AAV5DTM1_ELECO|nr:hypothetical protein PR202_gb00218 [Eleusine coracana subsp. coracana]